jgi:LysR family transcriptional regulator, mexEF-oprN operon transcriptional activator
MEIITRIDMSTAYARDLDLNLLRVFIVVAETGSVTAAASRLYLTQPAVSAALKRLANAVGAPLFARHGRGLVLTSRGARLLAGARPHLEALVAAALSPAAFDPSASTRVVRVGLSDFNEGWLLPPLLRVLANEAPRMRLVVVPVQFRTVAQALASGAVDCAVTVADELPAGTRRSPLFTGTFTCLFDPRHARVGKRLTRAAYLAHHHVVVSYNGDLRGIVEDFLGMTRNVRISVPSFQSVGALVDGSALLATVPLMVARQTMRWHPELRTAALPFPIAGTPMELLWRGALDDDDPVRFVMRHVTAIAKAAFGRASA